MNTNTHKKKTNIKKTPTTQIESVAMVISKSTLKKPMPEKAKKRQLRVAKKILKDPLLFYI